MKRFPSSIRLLVWVAAVAGPGASFADVPDVEKVGRPAVISCGLDSAGKDVKAVHADKVVFRLIGPIQAALAADQAALDALPRMTALDIKILDDARKVAHLRSKVATFIGAMTTTATFDNIEILEVAYSMVCPAALPR